MEAHDVFCSSRDGRDHSPPRLACSRGNIALRTSRRRGGGGHVRPLDDSCADKELGNPVLFWIDTETGELQEHAEGGDRIVTYTGKLDLKEADTNVFLARHAEQNEIYRIDLGISVHPFQRSVDDALTSIGACVPAAMGKLLEEDAAPVWPFTYRKSG